MSIQHQPRSTRAEYGTTKNFDIDFHARITWSILPRISYMKILTLVPPLSITIITFIPCHPLISLPQSITQLPILRQTAAAAASHPSLSPGVQLIQPSLKSSTGFAFPSNVDSSRFLLAFSPCLSLAPHPVRQFPIHLADPSISVLFFSDTLLACRRTYGSGRKFQTCAHPHL